ncbi:7-carboxy-7-deazaguanine synthase QueE [Salinisphaera sp. Q1T1-3]|uniref:7-carboxy-7-deazaguanine synthase QueE n=1 Tax=Salinisphaera sp. Q1T1-3 TaxID=2321229 RepID=UPI00272DA9A5|nr:7-carboxy-7-deazaguanine synthase QueE [Salinisphaera sp. Q1T1-3]
MDALRITEIFCSLQGEANGAGRVCTFIRLTGCPLRCHYCDTAYAFHGGEWMPLDAIVARAEALGATDICVTGGEPLAQPNVIPLVARLCDAGYAVSVETAGALDIRSIDTRASRVVDIKTPGSGEDRRNRWDNIEALTDHDQLKFVICSRADYEWARDTWRGLSLPAGATVWFSPSAGEITARDLADWIVADRIDVRFQLQLHKLLWGDAPGH